LVAEDIANKINDQIGLSNVVYISANNGDILNDPNSIDILLDGRADSHDKKIKEIVQNSLNSINSHRLNFIDGDIYNRFMRIKD
jgi:S-adenosylmethionine synthetase